MAVAATGRFRALPTAGAPGRGYALFIAVLPVLMMYKVPVIGIGVSTAMIIVSFFYAAAVIFNGVLRNSRQYQIAKIMVPFVLYLAYTAVKSAEDPVNMIQTMLIIVHVIAFSTGAVNAAYLKKYIIVIAVLASLLTILQTAVHYVFGVHIPCIAPELCLDSLQYYRGEILTGYQEVSDLYRPSAFFLEPSHLTQYSFVALLLCLFHGERQVPAAIFISAGMVATTSGMGIMLSGGIWLLYIAHEIRRSGFAEKIVKISGLIVGLAVILAVLFQLEFFRSSILRVFSPIEYSADSYNAIWGRTLYWDTYITPMSGRQLVFGLGYASLPDEYFTGLMELIYCSGITGVVLYYAAMLSVAVRCRGVSRITACLLCALMLVANVTSIISMTYYIGILLVFGLEPSRQEVAAGFPAGPASEETNALGYGYTERTWAGKKRADDLGPSGVFQNRIDTENRKKGLAQ